MIFKENRENVNMDKINFISLFCGCGGMDLGFSNAGFNCVYANDIDHWACMTYKRNLGDHVHEADISEVKFDKLPKVDLIVGGFPCQDFSMIWKRKGLDSERGNLYQHFVRAVRTIKPKMFVAENVKGLLTANKGKAIKQIIEDFSAEGYNVTYKVVNFAHFGTPQLRERVIIVGVSQEIEKEFTFPKPTHAESEYVTAKEALEGVESVLFNNEHQNIQPRTIERLKIIPPGENYTSIPKEHPLYVKGMISHVYRRLHPDKPSTTIIARGGGGTWGYHYEEPRSLTNRERARLFGYPDDFIFEGSFGEIRKQIGNSVPPDGILPTAKAINKFLQNDS